MTINEAEGGREDEEKHECREEGAIRKEKARPPAGNCAWMGRAGGNA